MRSVLSLLALSVLLCWQLPSQQPATPKSPGSGFESAVKPLLTKRCLMCHNSKLQSGELDLQHHSQPATALTDRDVWEAVVQKLRTGEMPPPGLPKPTPAEITQMSNFIERHYEQQDKLAKPDPGRVTARRLNRFEYNNTIRDLLAVDFAPDNDFPADDSGYGFDNIADVLSLSPLLMEKYLTAAERISRRAIVDRQPSVPATRISLKAETRGSDAVQAGDSAPNGPAAPGGSALHVRHVFPADGEYDIRLALGGSRRGIVQPVIVSIWLDGQQLETIEVDPSPGKKRAFESRLRITAGEHALGAAFIEPLFSPALAQNKPNERLLSVDSFEIRGPYNAVPPGLPESHKLVMACGHEPGHHTGSCARVILKQLARRAFRRPAQDAEIRSLEALVSAAQAQGDTLEGAVRTALQAILVSPHFLFRIERDPDPNDASTNHPLTEVELASRLSYFLWSSMPDEELLRLAEQTQIRASLRQQVHRMLSDPKAEALAENFAGQWLQLRNLDEAKPDPDRFPLFDDQLRAAMKRETQLFFNAILRENRSILEFLDAKWSFLNDRLAVHYGIEGIQGPEFRRVDLKTPQRKGILTHASVLTVSSYPTRTSPVIRGKWVLENLLNAPPPPPPPGVPALDEEAVGNTGSLRQQLEQHRTNPVCASCHSRMDPLGFGLENYDATGAWRTLDGKFPIDSSGMLPNGKSFGSPSELVDILLEDQREFTACLAEKLLIYGLGRGLERYDRRVVQSIVRQTGQQNFRFSALITAIVESLPFQMRRGEGQKT